MAAHAAVPSRISKSRTRAESSARRTSMTAPATRPVIANGLSAIQANSAAGKLARALGWAQ